MVYEQRYFHWRPRKGVPRKGKTLKLDADMSDVILPTVAGRRGMQTVNKSNRNKQRIEIETHVKKYPCFKTDK